MEVVFFGRKRYQGLHCGKVPPLPKDTVALSFLLKPVVGAAPNRILVTGPDKNEAPGTAEFSVIGDDWQKVRVRLDELTYAAGPKHGQPFPVTPGTVYPLRLTDSASDEPAKFLIDDVAWEIEP